MNKTILKLSLALSILVISSCSNNDSSSSYNSGNSYQETKMSLEDQERANPASFLSIVDGTYRQNLIGEWVIEGTISSSATVASMKDIELRINYFSKTETDLGAHTKTIYEVIAPRGSKKFKIKIFGPDGASKIALDISSALPN